MSFQAYGMVVEGSLVVAGKVFSSKQIRDRVLGHDVPRSYGNSGRPISMEHANLLVVIFALPA